MGFFDNLRETFGGDRDEARTDSSPEADLHAVAAMSARHVNHDAPAEAPEDAAVVTGGKHAARD
jgi:hypothetical protein